MKPIYNIFAAVAAGTFVFGAAMTAPLAQTPAVTQDKAQMKADESALAREKAQLNADQKMLKGDTKSGKSAAESPDAKAVREDKSAIAGQKKAIANDAIGSAQKKADRAALRREQKQL